MNNQRQQRIVSTALLIVVFFTFMTMFTACATATEKIPIPTVKEHTYIYDEDNVIDDDVENTLNSMLVELEEKTSAEFAVVSIESLLGRSIEDYANNLFNTLGIGKKGKDNGVLLLISRSDTKVRLEIGRGLEGVLNDAKCGRILDNFFVPYRETGEYSKATEQTVKAVLNVLAEEYSVEITGLENELAENTSAEENSNNSGLIAIIVVVVVFAIAFIIGFLVSIADDDSPGGGSSGGFFFDSGSSGGGGFGGGFSVGGGASR